MSAERLQKLLARAGVASRRKVEELIVEQRVTVNGRIATLGDKADLEVDSVKLDGKRIRLPDRQRYLLMNKPKGVLTTLTDDKGRPTVIDLIPQGLRNGLFPVGRLDFQTEGLLVLTTDGELAQRIAHPRFGCRKLYEVKVKGVPREEEIEKLRRGIVIDGRRTRPAYIDPLRRTARGEDEGNTWYEVQLGEGRSRQIREMFFRIGHPVQKLKRVAIGPLRDPELPSGTFRTLDEKEIEALRTAGADLEKGARGATRGSTRPPAERTSGGPRKPAVPTRSRSPRTSASAARPERPADRPRRAEPARRSTAAPGRASAASPFGRRREAADLASRPAIDRDAPRSRRTGSPDRDTMPKKRSGHGPRPGGGTKDKAPRRPNEAPWRRPEGASDRPGRRPGAKVAGRGGERKERPTRARPKSPAGRSSANGVAFSPGPSPRKGGAAGRGAPRTPRGARPGSPGPGRGSTPRGGRPPRPRSGR